MFATRTDTKVQDSPTRVEVISQEEIEEESMMTPGNIVMMLNEMGGLRVQTTSPSLGAASVRIQGMRGRYTAFLGDGLPLFGQEGLLLVKGPNRMMGYLGEPEKTADVLRDGWYVTGDIATIDEAGFVRITDRLSRFSKIAGEMVPHLKIEEQIQTLIGDHHSCAVTSIPDDTKGERLVAFHTYPEVKRHDLWERLCRTDLPRLWLPKREDLHFIESVPTLGTGKVDLRGVRQLALDRAASAV